jgi:hypothetical protein
MAARIYEVVDYLSRDFSKFSEKFCLTFRNQNLWRISLVRFSRERMSTRVFADVRMGVSLCGVQYKSRGAAWNGRFTRCLQTSANVRTIYELKTWVTVDARSLRSP